MLNTSHTPYKLLIQTNKQHTLNILKFKLPQPTFTFKYTQISIKKTNNIIFKIFKNTNIYLQYHFKKSKFILK